MANRTVNTFDLAGADYNDIRTSLKDFLKSDGRFTAYNFEGSNLSTLVDLLAYNSHYLIVYLNHVANELFLDSAAQRESIVSHAKSLDYLPRSKRASSVSLNIEVVSDDLGLVGDTLTIPRWSKFTASSGSSSFTFLNDEPVSATWEEDGIQAVAVFENVIVKEGRRLNATYIVDNTDNELRYIVPNENVDTSSIKVTIQVSRNDLTQSVYAQYDNIVEIEADTRAFFLQELLDGKYEVLFGDGVFGNAPDSGNLVIIDYLVSNGETANGVRTFRLTKPSDWTVIASEDITVSLYDANSGSSGGADRETDESIRVNAPRWYQAQYRAVSSQDYKAKVIKDFSTVEAISVWGGEENDPPQFGKVFLCIKPKHGKYLTLTQKAAIKTAILEDYRVVTVTPEIVDPTFLYLMVDSTVYYDSRTTTLSKGEVSDNVVAAIEDFADDNLSAFLTDFEYSRCTEAIDDADRSITSNLTTVRLGLEFVPTTGRSYSTTLEFGNPIKKVSTATRGYISSTAFVFGGVTAKFEDNPSTEKLTIINASTSAVLEDDAGTIDYETGTILVDGVTFDSYTGNAVRVSMLPERNNVTTLKTHLLTIDSEDISTNLIDVAEN